MMHPDRLFPVDPGVRQIARDLFSAVRELPIVSPHGHTDPRWWAENSRFEDPAKLLIVPDHYLIRMLVSAGVSYDQLGHGPRAQSDSREIWRLFAAHYDHFRGTPTRMWFDTTLSEVFGIETRLSLTTADAVFDQISEALAGDDCRPRALFERFNVEVIATTDSALDDLRYHRAVRDGDWSGRVVPTYRPDGIVDPQTPGFADNLDRLAGLTGCDTSSWTGYLDAHRVRRAYFREHGATATDHGHPSARTVDLSDSDAKALFAKVRSGRCDDESAELFRAQMLTECARMSCDDGMVMQLHAGVARNHNLAAYRGIGQDIGFDIPVRGNFTHDLHPLLNACGMDPRLRLVLFTLDEATYARELAPLAGVWPALRLGPPWWFHDSFEGMMRFRKATTETAGFLNTVGFNDDTRAICSIAARHDMARRADCAFLAELVATHRLDEDEAHDLAPLLAADLARQSYNL